MNNVRFFNIVPVSAFVSLALVSSPVFSEAASSKVQPVSYSQPTTPLKSAQARTLIQKYYNNHGSWAGIYKLQKIRGMRLKHINVNRIEAHVEYEYQATNAASIKPSSGIDKRTFVFIRHRDWNIIGMGRHDSAKLK